MCLWLILKSMSIKQYNISDLTWDQSIYPRSGKSQKTIEAYIEALEAGAEFPAIRVQKVINYPVDGTKKEASLIIDGLHRFFAFRELGRKEIPAIEPDDAPLDYEKNRISLLLESANANITHGDRLTSNDKKRVARDIAASDPDCRWTEEAMSEKLGITRQAVNTWISDIRARQKAGRNIIIMRLSRLGWTHEQISGITGLTHGRITQIVNNANFCEINNLLSQGRDMEYIARHYHMDMALAWALRLEEKTDKERFRELGWGLRAWDQWNFNECDERFGDDWPGRIPAQLIAHTLYYFTKPGDFVLDPMAGGGVVPDVCMLFKRKCSAFDLAPVDNRPEIKSHYWDLKNLVWPVTRKPDLIFFDPPYFNKKAKEYELKADGNARPISSYGREEYLDFFKRFFQVAHKNSKESTRLAFLNADWRDFESTPALLEKPDNSITIFDYRELLSKTGWKVIHRVECPLSSERLTGNEVQKMQDKRILGTVLRTLLVARKI